jgi:hypothetical protein
MAATIELKSSTTSFNTGAKAAVNVWPRPAHAHDPRDDRMRRPDLCKASYVRAHRVSDFDRYPPALMRSIGSERRRRSG